LNSKTDRVLVGRIAHPHGLDGFLVVVPESDHPGRFRNGARFWTEAGELTVRRSRSFDSNIHVAFEGFDDRTSAERLTGLHLYISSSERRTLRAGEFWPDELVGLEARLPNGSVIGPVSAVVVAESQSRLVIVTSEGEREVPFVAELVPEVNVAEGFLVVAAIDGLLD